MTAGQEEAALTALGIGTVDARIYTLLIEHSRLSVAEIARTLGVSVGSAQRGVASLHASGFVTRSPTAPPLYVPVAPDLLVETLIVQRQMELERARVVANQLRVRHQAAAKATSPNELVEIVTGRPALVQQFLQMQRSVQSELLILDKPPYVTPGAECKTAGLEMRRRPGVVQRVIYDHEAFEAPGQLEGIRNDVCAGEQARTMAGLPMKLAVADRRLGLIPLRLEEPAPAALVLHKSPLLEAVVALFETLWERATPIGLQPPPANPPDRHGLSNLDHQTLELLATGLKDQAVARQLGIGQRTMERRVGELLGKLGARTRFQAGVEFATRARKLAAEPAEGRPKPARAPHHAPASLQRARG